MPFAAPPGPVKVVRHELTSVVIYIPCISCGHTLHRRRQMADSKMISPLPGLLYRSMISRTSRKVLCTLFVVGFGCCAVPNDFIHENSSPQTPHPAISSDNARPSDRSADRGSPSVSTDPVGFSTRCSSSIRTAIIDIHPVQFQHPHGHHRQIGHHVVLAQKRPHRLQHGQGGDVAGAADVLKGLLGTLVPRPCVVERFDLREALFAVRGLEQLVIAGIRVERRVQIDQVDTLGRDTLPQDGEVVAIIQLVPARCPLRVPYAGIVAAKG